MRFSYRGVFITDELAVRHETDCLSTLISLSICLDDCLRKRRRERAGQFQRHSPLSPLPESACSAQGDPSAPSLIIATWHLGGAHADRKSLSCHSWAPGYRVKDGLCIYRCQRVHLLSSCPVKPNESAHQELVCQADVHDPAPALHVLLLAWSKHQKSVKEYKMARSLAKIKWMGSRQISFSHINTCYSLWHKHHNWCARKFSLSISFLGKYISAEHVPSPAWWVLCYYF